MHKHHFLIGALLALWILFSIVPAAADTPPVKPDVRCQEVRIEKPVLFRGRTLVETPDIMAPDLRLANSLLSHRCRAAAIQLLEKYTKATPTDYRVTFLQARLAWTAGDTDQTQEILTATLREHPDFASAQVLQASLLIEQGQLDKADPLLDSLSLHSPTDLWVFMDGLQLEALRSPSQALRETLLEIDKNPGFPPSAREAASRVGRHLATTRDQFEAYYWADLDYESATPTACKIHNLAFLLSEDGGRFEQARALLESPKGRAADCMGTEGNRVLLAQTYLMEAARISAVPSAANAALVSKAHEILGGDWSGLARHIIGRPQFGVLQPFIASGMAPDEVDQGSHTQICNAVMQSNAPAVQAQLDLGADPNGQCEGYSLIGLIVMSTGREASVARQAVVRLLRGAGAKVTPLDIERCSNPDNGRGCARDLLPLLQ